MSTICRTCLQKSNKTFKTNQTIEDYNGGEVKISLVLRFCIPELYLGLSSNPEICSECRESLKAAYLFKKKCLYIENIIGNFLKTTRCTARSVDLFDVLGYLEGHVQVQLQQEVEKAKQNITQDILSEWDEVSDEPVNSEKNIQEVRQSAPNPINPQDNSNNTRLCHQTGSFFDQQVHSNDCLGNLGDKIGKDKVQVRTEVTNHQDTTVGEAQVMKNRPNFVQDTENLCKIANVFSLNPEITDKDPTKDTNSVNNASDLRDANTNNTNGNLADMRNEPIKVEINGELVDFNCYPTEKEALPTTSNEDMQCTSSLQGIIDNLPEISEDDQYVDVPEFVHISNVSRKELNNLRWQQQINGTVATKKLVLNFQNKLPPMSCLGSSKSSEENSKSKATQAVTKVPFASLPETLVVDGKIMVKCGKGYKLKGSPDPKPALILNRKRKALERTNSATQGKKKRRLPTA